jgi:metal-responsive CopG/Arc/MetJ family transcriptional regulator
MSQLLDPQDRAVPMGLSLPARLWARLAALVPKNQRSKFIREAVVERIERAEAEGMKK